MSENEEKQINETNNNEVDKPLVPAGPKPQLSMTAAGFVPTNMDEAWRFANALSRTNMVPQNYRDKPDECLIVLDLAARLKTNWLAVMQHTYDIHGRLGFEAKFVLALINRSGLYVDPLEYEVKGENADDDDYAVRAYATSRKTKKILYGPWITWKLVKAEKWSSKKESKWLTMPEQMFHYRAASWFKNRHCPEVTIGIQTIEDIEDAPERKPVESLTYGETEQQTQEQIEAEQGSQPVEAEFEQPAAEEEKPQEKPAKKTRKKPAKKNEGDFEWTCLACKAKGRDSGFNKPAWSGPKEDVPICPNPKCLSADIVRTEEAVPMKEDEAA